MALDGISIKYKPLPISNDITEGVHMAPSTEEEDIAVANKLIQHLNLIKEYQDKLDAINYLSANAAKLAGNPKYTTSDPKLISNIKDLGGSGDTVDFELFQKAVDIVIEGYKNMALTALTGVNNA